MSVFKEEAHFLDSLEKRQKRIWDDSCDLGILRKDLHEAEVVRLREVINTLLKLPGSKITWRAEQPAQQRHYYLVILWGLTHNAPNEYDGTTYNVLYYKGKKKEFFSISKEAVLVTAPKDFEKE